ncbi:uncharacterized protein TM35_000281780 [Trypanosoma theileri]|uniref:Uncharacterized protein n=1 Tax=Trypanosoma theileri TaxID=67003 RepID=A0A1X0NP23_9TRYP|nr:uncharacterized protein TM35_000281780 [Trypanosoma theileri]ORC86462.1 hypothetical protein TM35_000281780 [Trypanosoma theileri]
MVPSLHHGEEQEKQNIMDAPQTAETGMNVNLYPLTIRRTTRRKLFAQSAQSAQSRMYVNRNEVNTNIIDSSEVPDKNQTVSTNEPPTPSNGTFVYIGIPKQFVPSKENGNSFDFDVIVNTDPVQKRLSAPLMDTANQEGVNHPISSLPRVNTIDEAEKKKIKNKEDDIKKRRREIGKGEERNKEQFLSEISSSGSGDLSSLKGAATVPTFTGHSRRRRLPKRNNMHSSRLVIMETADDGPCNSSQQHKEKEKEEKDQKLQRCLPLRNCGTSSSTLPMLFGTEEKSIGNSSSPKRFEEGEGGVCVKLKSDLLCSQNQEKKNMSHSVSRTISGDDSNRSKCEVEENDNRYLLVSINENSCRPLKSMDHYKGKDPNQISEIICGSDTNTEKNLSTQLQLPFLTYLYDTNNIPELLDDDDDDRDNVDTTQPLVVLPSVSSKNAEPSSNGEEIVKSEEDVFNAGRNQESHEQRRRRRRRSSWWTGSSLRQAFSRLYGRHSGKNSESSGNSASSIGFVAQLHQEDQEDHSRKKKKKRKSIVVSPVRALPPSSRRFPTSGDSTHCSPQSHTFVSGKTMHTKRCDASAFRSVVSGRQSVEIETGTTTDLSTARLNSTNGDHKTRRVRSSKGSLCKDDDVAVFSPLVPFLTVQSITSEVGDNNNNNNNNGPESRTLGSESGESSILSF